MDDPDKPPISFFKFFLVLVGVLVLAVILGLIVSDWVQGIAFGPTIPTTNGVWEGINK